MKQKFLQNKLLKETKYLKINFQITILLDKEYEKDDDKRMEKAFRNLADDEKDVELFESYIRGGIEILYEKCVATSIQKDDFMENIVGFLEEIKDKYPKEYCF